MISPNNQEDVPTICPIFSDIKEKEYKGENDISLVKHQANCPHPCCKATADYLRTIFKQR